MFCACLAASLVSASIALPESYSPIIGRIALHRDTDFLGDKYSRRGLGNKQQNCGTPRLPRCVFVDRISPAQLVLLRNTSSLSNTREPVEAAYIIVDCRNSIGNMVSGTRSRK